MRAADVLMDSSIMVGQLRKRKGRVANNFAEVMFRKNNLQILLRPIAYEDPRGLVDVLPQGYNWSLNRRVYLRSVDDLDYVMGLIEQSYRDVL